ncbi:hypothetical protein Tco_1280633 [Tanacetum coccineum]
MGWDFLTCATEAQVKVGTSGWYHLCKTQPHRLLLRDTIVIGSSGGLFCLYALDKAMLVVWNPSIRRSVGIVAPRIFEVFGFVVCPVSNDPTVVKILFPCCYRGSLVVILPYRDVNVWKMEGDSSFTKLFTINTPDSSIRNILRFGKNGELVIETQEGYNPYGIFGGKDSALEVYDRFSQHMNNLTIYGLTDSFFISSYKETLLLLDHLDSCVYPDIS